MTGWWIVGITGYWDDRILGFGMTSMWDDMYVGWQDVRITWRMDEWIGVDDWLIYDNLKKKGWPCLFLTSGLLPVPTTAHLSLFIPCLQLSIFLSIYLSICNYLSSLFLSICIYLSLSIYLTIYLSIDLFVSIYLSIRL